MAWTFPPLTHSSVFIGSPSDVEFLREGARREFDRLMREVADNRGIKLYMWEWDFEETDPSPERKFRPDRPYQGSIPLPAGDNCAAAIFLFGETIGSELPTDFPTQDLDGSPAGAAAHPLLRHWDKQSPGDGFPLTGSTFEYLVAEAAGVTCLRLFFGDKSIDTDDPVFNQHWGLNRLRKEKEKENEEDFEKQRVWIDKTAFPQRMALRNFYRYLKGRTLPVEVVSTEEEARRAIRRFLIETLKFETPEKRINPFRGLVAYGEDDNDVFFGRNTVKEEIVAAIQDRVENCRPDRRPFFRISGTSGSGKSSLMRAGVVTRLKHRLSLGNWVSYVTRPGELAAEAGKTGVNDTLLPLFVECLKAIDPQASLVAASRQLAGTPQRAPAAVEELVKALDRRRGLEKKGKWRLLLGLDQFEHCVEDLSENPALWENFIAFLDAATNTGRIAVVYTIPLSRLVQMNRYPLLERLSVAGAEKQVSFPSETVEEIIDKSFAMAKLELAPDLRQKLLDAMEELHASTRGEDQGSVLPLLSLAMTGIYERWEVSDQLQEEEETFRKAVEKVRKRRRADTALAAEFKAAEAADQPMPAGPGVETDGNRHGETGRPRLSLQAYGDLAELTSVIDREGAAAISEARQHARGLFIDDETLPQLLRSLVRFTIRDTREFDLQSIAPQRDPSAQALVEALHRHRLLAENRDGRLRLVHATVLRHWTDAAAWVKNETSRLDYVSGLARSIRIWEEKGRAPLVIAGLCPWEQEGAAEVLYAWGTTLAPAAGQGPNDEHANLRDFLVAILKYLSTPAEHIVALEKGPTHFHAAVAANARDLVRYFLDADPGNAKLTRSKDQRSALFDAATFNRVEILQDLLQAEAPVNASDLEGWLPLHAAAARGSLGALSALAPLTADINATGGPAHVSALTLAAGNGHIDCVAILLDRNANAGQGLSGGWTPLHNAALGGHAEIVRLLLRRHADVDACIEDGWTALHLTAQEGHEEAAADLIKADAKVDAPLSNGLTPLHLAALNGREPMVNLLLRHSAAVDSMGSNDWRTSVARAADRRHKEWINQDWTPLHLAAERGRDNVARVLLLAGANPNAQTDQGKTPLHIAVEKDQSHVVWVLLAHDGTNVDARDREHRTPLQLALRTGDYAAAQRLLSGGASIDAFQAEFRVGLEQKWTPLHFAAAGGEERQVEFLLKNKADPDARNADGWVPLEFAARYGRDQIARLLLDQGAHIEQARRSLHLAAEFGHERVTDLLLARGVPGDSRDESHWTPLHVAAQNGHAGVVRLLLAKAPETEVESAQPALTPLQVAAEAGQVEAVEALIEGHASVHAQTKDRAQPLLLAIGNAQYQTALRLLDAGADPGAAGLDGITVAEIFTAHRTRRARSGHPASPDEQDLARRLQSASVLPAETRIEAQTAFDIKDVLDGRTSADVLVRQEAPRETQIAPPSPATHFANINALPWRPMPDGPRSDFLERISPIDGKYDVTPPRTQVWLSPLSFYDRAWLVRVRDPQWEIQTLFIYYVLLDSDLYRLNGTSPPVHTVNEKAPIRLNEANVLDYLRFFCFFVRGEEGPFYVAETPDDPVIPKSPAVDQIIRGTVRPATLQGTNEEGHFLCDAVIYYSNALFLATFAVQPTGSCQMTDDEAIAADLPLRIDAPIG